VQLVNRSLTKQNRGYCFSIPKAFLENHLLSTEKRYNIKIEEVA